MKTMKILGLLCAALVSLGAISRGEIFVDEADLAQSRFRATNEAYSCVVLLGGLQSNIWNAFGSAVAIPSPGVTSGAKWFLCAAHQVAPGSVNGTYDGLRVTIKSPVDNHVVERGYVDRVYIHPSWRGSIGYDADFALLRITNAVTQLTPAVINAEPLPTTVLMYLTGYGMYGIVGTFPGAFDGAKRSGCNIMGDVSSIWVEPQYMLCSFDQPGLFDSQPGEWQIADFDSGGGGFVITNGQMKFAATICLGRPNGNWDFYSRSGVLPIAPYLDWIYGTIASVEQPTLTLKQLDASHYEVSWPSAASDFVLQTSCDCSEASWVPAGLAFSDDGTNCVATVTTGSPSQFWRLARQNAPAAARLAVRGSVKALTPIVKAGGPTWSALLPLTPVPEK